MGKTGLPCGCDPQVEQCPKCFTPSKEYCKRCGSGIERCECPEKVAALRARIEVLEKVAEAAKRFQEINYEPGKRRMALRAALDALKEGK